MQTTIPLYGFGGGGGTGATLLAYVRQLPGVHYAYQIDDSFVHMDVA